MPQSIDLSSLMDCSIPLQVDSILYSQMPIVQTDVGRIGTTVRMEGEGFIASDNAADFAAALLALETNGSLSGVTFTVYGVDQAVTHQVTPDVCWEGGPHVGFRVMPDGGGGYYRRVQFVMDARTASTVTLSSYTTRTVTGPDGLQRVTQTGTIVGQGTIGYYSLIVLPTFKAAYPPAQWVVTSDVQTLYGTSSDPTSIQTRYTLAAVQLAGPLPAGGGVTVVEGSVNQRTDRDDQQRMLTVTEYELLCTGDPTPLVAVLRPAVVTNLVHESWVVESVRQWRLRAAFTVLKSADNTNLANWNQTITVTDADDTVEQFTYPGVAPIAVIQPAVFPKYSQSGSATGITQFVQEPSPLLTDYLSQPVIRYTDRSNYEKETSWTYEMVDLSAGANAVDIETALASIARPAQPGFL